MSNLTGVATAMMLLAILQTSHCAQWEVTKNWDYSCNGRR